MSRDEGEGFLSRWSRRKAQRPEVRAEKAAVVVPAAVAAAPPQAGQADPKSLESAKPTAPVTATTPTGPAAPPLPTLEDVAQLSRDSDFSPYVDRQVSPQVRNAAMKKLFSDPHFNVMDGLDTYIDDYGKPDPLPLSMLRQMTQARALGLFDEEDRAEAKTKAQAEALAADAAAKASPDGTAPPVLAQSAPDEAQATHEDTDLRLQSDDAAGPGGTAPGAGHQG